MLLWLHNLDFAGGGDPSLGPQKAGKVGGKKQRRIVVEVDGEFFEVGSVAEAESVLLQVRELAQQSATQDVTTPQTPKPPKIRVLGPSGKPTTSPTLQRAVKQTQRVVTRAYIDRSKEIQQLIEVARQREDEELAITLLL